MSRINWLNAIVTAIVSFAAGLPILVLAFGNPISYDLIYTDRAGQSSKVLDVWLRQEPLPPISAFWDQFFVFSDRKLAIIGLLLVWSLCLVIVYATIHPSLPGKGWRKGLSFGVMIWVMVSLFFEIFTPINMFGEPIGLALLELLLWLPGIVVIGVLIAVLYRPPQPT